MVFCPLVGRDYKRAILQFLKRFCPFPQGEAGFKRLNLLHKALYQVAGKDLRIGRDIVNRLFGIDLRALSPGLR